MVRAFLCASWRAAAVAAACLAILAGATGCGTATSSHSTAAGLVPPSVNPLAGLTAGQIALKAIADLEAASSVHIAGTAWGDSSQQIVIDVNPGTTGCTGTVEIHGQGSFVLLRIGQTLWVKPDSKFWKFLGDVRGHTAIPKPLEGKYVRTSPPLGYSGLSRVGEVCYLGQIASFLGYRLNGLVKGRTTTFSGQPALEIMEASGPGRAYVTMSASPEFLRFESDGYLDFTGYNAPMTVTPPPASETVDGSKYGF